MKINVGRLVNARLRAGLTRPQAAKLLDMAVYLIGAIEQHLQEPTESQVAAFAAAYRVDQRFLLMQPPFEATTATKQSAI